MTSFKSLFTLALCIGLSLNLQLMRHQTITEQTHVQIFDHPINLQEHLQTIGGYTNVPIDQANKEIDNYIRSQIPELAGASLVKVQSQIVNGTNYSYTYNLGQTLYTVLVWDQPNDRTRQIRGIAKIVTSTNSQGQTVKTSTITRLSNLNFQQEANKLFN